MRRSDRYEYNIHLVQSGNPKRVTDKQSSPRSDAAERGRSVASDQGLHCLQN